MANIGLIRQANLGLNLISVLKYGKMLERGKIYKQPLVSVNGGRKEVLISLNGLTEE